MKEDKGEELGSSVDTIEDMTADPELVELAKKMGIDKKSKDQNQS